MHPDNTVEHLIESIFKLIDDAAGDATGADMEPSKRVKKKKCKSVSQVAANKVRLKTSANQVAFRLGVGRHPHPHQKASSHTNQINRSLD